MNWMLGTRKIGANGDTFDLIEKEEIQPKVEREKPTQKNNWTHGFLIFLLSTFVTGIGGDQAIAELRGSVSGSLKSDEICQMEDFRATCDAGQVIVIRSAKLGRLEMGRCIKDNKHELGCFVDVLVEMDRLCSGRRECVLKVDDRTFQRSTSCHLDLKNHLWTTHECVKVTLPANNCDVLRLQSGILSNFVTESSMCGMTESPWVIEVNRGQRINVTLVDFASSVSHLSKQHHQQQQQQGSDDESSLYPRRCRVYATIREAGTTHGNSRTVCGGPDRVNAVFLSVSEKIEIRFLTSRGLQKPSAQQQDSVYFLLQFNAVGCADPQLPKDMWMRRMTGSSDTATIGCVQSDLSWELNCKDSQWMGYRGNCSTDRSVSAALGMPHALSTMIIVIIALTVSCVILTIGVLCIKRRIVEEREVRRLQRQIRSQCEADYGIGTMSDSKLAPDSVSAAAAAAAHSSSAAAAAGVGAVILADPTGNEYARMRLQRMTDYAGCPPYGFDAPNSYGGGGGVGGGCGYKYPTVEHVYESPDSLRRDDSMSRRNPHYTSRIHGGGGDQRQPPPGVGPAGAGVGRPAKPSSPQAATRVVVVGPSEQEAGTAGGPCTPNKSKNAGNYSL